jgi:hypothetical protein
VNALARTLLGVGAPPSRALELLLRAVNLLDPAERDELRALMQAHAEKLTVATRAELVEIAHETATRERAS